MEKYTDQYVRHAQQKVNGLNITIKKCSNGNVYATSRVKEVDFLPYLLSNYAIKLILDRLPLTTTVNCELTTPDQVETDVIHHCKNNKPLHLWFLSFPWYNGRSGDLLTLEGANQIALRLGFYVPYTETFINNIQIHKDYWNKRAKSNGYEGWVFKQHHLYGHYKLKPINTVDCFVISTQLSESSSYYGGLGAIEVGIFDKLGESVSLGKVGTGFTKHFRMNCVHSQLLFRVAEIAYDLLSRDNKLKRPRFLRWRDDKPASECTIDQLK